jgi:hypothetical protein
VLKTGAGMHRFIWDMHYDPIPGTATGGRGDGGGNDPVPHRTYPSVDSPWVAPGLYSVRLTANGKSQTQPIAVKLDPRVRIAPEVQRIFTLTTEIENQARAAAGAYAEARALADKLSSRPQSPATEALIKQVDEIAPPAPVRGNESGGRGGRGGAPEPAPPPNLANIGAQLVAAAMGMQASEMPPTAAELQACSRQQAAYAALMTKWAALKAKAR